MDKTLTPRQLDCVRLVALGLPNKRIAAALGIGESSVKNHLTAAYARLGVDCRTSAAVAFWRVARTDGRTGGH